MSRSVVDLAEGRRGHFRLESGYHGDLWLDLPRMYLRPGLVRPLCEELARRLSGLEIEMVCGPLVEGAFVGLIVAVELGAGFCFAERVAHPERERLFPVEYRLPPPIRDAVAGKRVAVVDDVISAGSATRGALADLRTCGALPVAIGSLLVLGESASKLAADEGVELRTLESRSCPLWRPNECPLCAAGEPLESLAD
jgi:orotate phosphoribosyltransferase